MSGGTFPVLTEIEQVFYDIVWRPLIVTGETYLEGVAPFLALPVVKQLDESVINGLTDALYHQLVLLVDISAVQLIDPIRQAAYEKASEQLVIVATEKGVNSSDYQQAKAQALADFSQFVHFNGG